MIHVLLGVIWSANRLYSIQNSADSSFRDFTVLRMATADHVTEPTLAASRAPNIVLPSGTDQPREGAVRDPTPQASSEKLPEKGNRSDTIADVPTNAPMGPFVSAIDPKSAWINVSESVNYNVLRGISMDVSQGEYRLPDELDVRVRARGNLTIEYPLIAAALGKEALVYVLLLIDEQGAKTRVEIARGDADFNAAALHALEKIEFRPAMVKRVPVRSLLLLEFDFRRDPPRPSTL